MTWDLVIQIAVTFVDFSLVYMFYKGFIGQEKKIGVLLHCVIAALYVAIIAFVSVNYSSGIKVPIAVMCLYLLTFLFDGNIKIDLFSVGLLTAFMIISEGIAAFGVELLSINSLFDDSTIFHIVAILSKLIMLIIIKAVCRFRNKVNTRLPFLYWLALLIFPIISSVAICLIYMVTFGGSFAGMSVLCFVSTIGLLYVNVFAFQFFESILDKTSLEMREKLMQQHIEAQMAQYQTVITEQQSRIRFHHDIKNNIELIHNLIKSGKADEALNCMTKIVELSAIDKEYVHTGNAVIDAVFNTKIRLAESKGIRVEIESMLIPKDIALEPIDMCVMFSNSLDNAIEACDRIEEGEKYIVIGLMHRDKSLAYKIKNPTDGKLVKGKKHFVTSKKTGEIHGIGIESIEKALLKYDGLLSVEHKDNVFEFGFIIPYI